MATWTRKTWKKIRFFALFWKNDPLRENFQNSVPKGFIATPIDELCSNFVKFDWREIVKTVRCLHDKKNKNFALLSCSSYCADCAQNLSGPPASPRQCVLRVLKISSKSVHFRRSYIRTREHHHSALDSQSNIRLSLASSRIKKKNRTDCGFEIKFNAKFFYQKSWSICMQSSNCLDKNSSGDEIANVNFYDDIVGLHVETSAYAHWSDFLISTITKPLC